MLTKWQFTKNEKNKQISNKKTRKRQQLWVYENLSAIKALQKLRGQIKKSPLIIFLLVLTPFEKQIPLKNKLLQVNNYEKVSHFIKKIDKLLLTVLTN